jgi:hypothetical protein
MVARLSPPPAAPKGKPCSVCISFGRSKSAVKHVVADCHLRPGSAGFNQKALDDALASRKRYLEQKRDGGSVTSALTTMTVPSAVVVKVPPRDKHLHALMSLAEEADTSEKKLSAFAAISDYTMMVVDKSNQSDSV